MNKNKIEKMSINLLPGIFKAEPFIFFDLSLMPESIAFNVEGDRQLTGKPTFKMLPHDPNSFGYAPISYLCKSTLFGKTC
jgi:hypothetical protein